MRTHLSTGLGLIRISYSRTAPHSNSLPSHRHRRTAIAPWHGRLPDRCLKSDCDEELLITLTFLQKVRLSGLSIKAPKEGGPSSVKLYANRADAADFDSTKALPVTQELTLSPANTLSAAVVPLLTAKFPSVYKLTILIEANHDDAEETVIEQLAVHGAVNEIVGKRNDSAPKWSEDSGVEKYEKARG